MSKYKIFSEENLWNMSIETIADCFYLSYIYIDHWIFTITTDIFNKSTRNKQEYNFKIDVKTINAEKQTLSFW